MSFLVHNNISALKALATKQSVTANNIANSETKAFKKSATVLEEGPNGAISTKTQPVNTPGAMVQQTDGTLEEMSNVDLMQETADMITTRHAYEANLKALKISTAMDDTLLDTTG